MNYITHKGRWALGEKREERRTLVPIARLVPWFCEGGTEVRRMWARDNNNCHLGVVSPVPASATFYLGSLPEGAWLCGKCSGFSQTCFVGHLLTRGWGILLGKLWFIGKSFSSPCTLIWLKFFTLLDGWTPFKCESLGVPGSLHLSVNRSISHLSLLYCLAQNVHEVDEQTND